MVEPDAEYPAGCLEIAEVNQNSAASLERAAYSYTYNHEYIIILYKMQSWHNTVMAIYTQLSVLHSYTHSYTHTHTHTQTHMHTHRQTHTHTSLLLAHSEHWVGITHTAPKPQFVLISCFYFLWSWQSLCQSSSPCRSRLMRSTQRC